MGASCVVFYSLPAEASKTAIARSLEICCCDVVYVISTLRHKEEVEALCRTLSKLVRDVEFKSLPVIPDVDRSPELIDEVTGKLENVVRSFGGRALCFTASAGSRLEVASLSLLLNKELTDVIYISFLWGPWRGSYYPFTPKPVQLAHVLHRGPGTFEACTREVNLNALSELLRSEELPKLRREVLKTQLVINSELRSRCLSHGGLDCPGVSVKVVYKGRECVSVEAENYCSWKDVVKLCTELSRAVDDLCSSTRDGSLCNVLSTILNTSGIRLLVVDECVGVDCSEYRNLALADAVGKLNDYVLVDTNVIYQGVHNYLYENPSLANSVLIPLSTYVELYEHQVHVDKSRLRTKVRAELSKLLIEELKYFKLKSEVRATATPSEVGIALIDEGIALTSDGRAYDSLYKWLGRRAVKTKLLSVGEVKFLDSEWGRMVSYGYYALAQLRALSKILGRVLSELGISIQVALH